MNIPHHLSVNEIKNRIKNLILEQGEKSNDLPNIVSALLFSQTQAHIFHLQTKSFSQHKALQDYYEEIDDLLDQFIESYQGEFGIIEDYKSFEVESYVNDEKVIAYFGMLLNMVKEGRENIESTHLQNIFDEIITLITQTIYKLKFLK